MKFYHGTTERNARAIESEGFAGNSIDGEFNTSGFAGNGNFTFLALTEEHAQGYGDAVLEVDTEDATYYGECPVTGLPEYVVATDKLNDQGFWELV